MGGRQHSRGPTGSWGGLALLLVAALAAIAFAAPARADENLQTSSTPPLADRSIGSRRHCRCRCGSGARRDRSGVRSCSADRCGSGVGDQRKTLQMSSPRWTTQCRRRKLRRNPERYHSLPSCKRTCVARPLIRGSHAERRGSITASHRSISRPPSAARQSTTRRAPKPNRQSHLPRPTALRRRTVRAPAAVPITERIALICPQILRQSVPKVVLITAIGIASGSRTAAQRSRRSRRFRHYLNAPFPRRVRASISRQTGSIKATRRASRLRSSTGCAAAGAVTPAVSAPDSTTAPVPADVPPTQPQPAEEPTTAPAVARPHGGTDGRAESPLTTAQQEARDSEGWSQVSTSRAAADCGCRSGFHFAAGCRDSARAGATRRCSRPR